LSKMLPKSKLVAGYNMTYLDLSKTHEIDALAGSFLLVKRELGEKLHWWDEDYFFYGEDIDFCYRIKKMGLKIYFVPEYKALHYKGVSSGIKKVSENNSRATNDTKIWATNHRFKAMEIFYHKHYAKQYPWVVNKMVLSAIELKKTLALRKYKA
ncbi:MAG: glycosyltransferase family 2 protein, partial [Candidatus Levyibacteriota bacterium]